MPSLGADMDEGTLLEWLVRPGEPVAAGQVVAVVDTAKSAVEVEAFESGVMGEQLVAPGTKVPVGTTLARISAGGGAGAGAVTEAPGLPRHDGAAVPAPQAVPAPVREPAVAAPLTAPPVTAPAVTAPAVTVPPATPLVRHRAAELGVELAQVHGSGPNGRVTRADVEHAATAAHAAVPAAPAPAPAVREPVPGIPAPAAPPPGARPPAVRRAVSPYARRLAREIGVDLASVPAGPGGRVGAAEVREAAARGPAARLAPPEVPPVAVPGPSPAPPAAASPAADPMRQAIARLMSRANAEIPHYYLETTVELADALAWMHARNRELAVADRLVPAALVLRAVARATARHPELNGFWVDDSFRPGTGVHLGVAVSLRGGGLVAPAIHDADRLGTIELMARLRDLVSRARARRLRRAELADPTITVTNLGEQGVEAVHGVIYPPQVALVGVGRVVERPWAVEGMLGVRPTVRITLAADHRATDGFVGSRFLNEVDRLLHTPEEP